MMHWLQISRLRRCILLVVLAVGTAQLLAQTALFQRLNWWADDAMHRLLGPVLDMSNLVVIDIDEESIDRLKPSLGAWPYARDIYANIVETLKARGAQTIGFDILFAEPRPGDGQFAQLLGDQVILAAAAFPRPPLRSESYLEQMAQVALPHLQTGADVPMARVPDGKPPSQHWPDITLPLSPFIEAGRARVGVISVRPDEDGMLRRLPLFHEAYGNVLPGFALASWAGVADISQSRILDGHYHIKDRSFPINDAGEVTLRYPSQLRGLVVVPFHEIVRELTSAQQVTGVHHHVYAGKTVIIGSSSIMFGDYAQTPLGRVSGLILSAVVRQSLAKGNVMQPVAMSWSIALLLVALLPALRLAWRKKGQPRLRHAIAPIITILLTVSTGFWLFSIGLKIEWMMPTLSGLIALVMVAGYGVVRMRSEQRRLHYERLAAQEANRLKGEFLAHMAHELRTPLTAIMGFNKINQLDDRIGNVQRVQNSAVIARNCEHLLKLVNDNLDYAKIEAGQVRVAVAVESIEAVVDDVVTTMGPLAAQKSLLIDTRYDHPLPAKVMIDAMRVKQILLNLMGNAIKFTEKGRIDILVRWREDRLDISVIDTGPGIDNAIAQRIFEPFQQGEAGEGADMNGTGLGLTIARSLVRLMGGDIELESWPGQGSRFRFWIPAPPAPQELLVPPPTTAVAVSLSGHVLLAEDDEDIRELMRRELISLGVRVTTVRNGLEAVYATQEHTFDVVLMDLEMPTMSGMEAAQVMRAGGIRIPIVALTAHTQGEETQAALHNGFDFIINKPVVTEALVRALSVILPAKSPAERATNSHLSVVERRA